MKHTLIHNLALLLLAITTVGLTLANRRWQNTAAKLQAEVSELRKPHLNVDWFIGGKDMVSDSDGIKKALSVCEMMSVTNVSILFNPRIYYLSNSITISNSPKELDIKLRGAWLRGEDKNMTVLSFHSVTP